MLNVPKLDDLDYERIFARAKSRIPVLTDEWTNFNDADPGITTLQTFAWLHDGLNYYLDATGDVHLRKYFKLLGIRPQYGPAQAALALEGEGELCVPEGAQFAAGDIPFEAQEAFCAPANRLCRLYAEENGALWERTGLVVEDGGFAPLFTLERGKPTGARFGFECPLSGEVRLFVPVERVGRNAFDGAFSLADVEWEWWDGGAWRTAETVLDETCGFLRSGFLTLKLDGETGAYPGKDAADAYYLRCRLARNEYDELPRIGRVLPCCVRVVQRRTWAKAVRYMYEGGGRLRPPLCVRPEDLLTVGVAADGGDEYEEWYRHAPDDSDLCEVAAGKDPWQRELCFDAQRFEKAPGTGAAVALLLLCPQAAEDAYLGMTDGCAGQRLTFCAQNVCALTLALVRTGDDGRRRFTLWRRCEDLMEAGCDDKVFTFDEAEQTVRFGDSLHGLEPEAGCEVWAVEIRTSLFGEGNARAGQIDSFEPLVQGVTAVRNPADAAGGRSPSTTAELTAEMERRMRAVTRAVTAQDYAALVKSTPGLRIASVAVLSAREYNAAYRCAESANTVLVAVKPDSVHQRRPVLSETYRRAIAAHLEQYRLLGVHIRVVSARYLGVGVYGRIALMQNTAEARAAVEQAMASFVETAETGEYGKTVDYGRLYAALEILDEVRAVMQLSLEYVGEGGRKNEHGDILSGPDTLTYLRETGIEYL